jgi:hypothetical protein
VSGVEQVEHSVSKCDAIFSVRPPPLRLGPRRNLRIRTPRRQRLLATDGWKCRTFSFLKGSLITSS